MQTRLLDTTAALQGITVLYRRRLATLRRCLLVNTLDDRRHLFVRLESLQLCISCDQRRQQQQQRGPCTPIRHIA